MTYEKLIELTDAGIEIWKPVPEYEGYYEISNLGRVKSIERWVKQGNSTRHVKESIKKIHINPNGYPSVTFCKNKISKDTPLHIVIAKAFIPNPENKPAIDHINTIRDDFSLRNLRWVTPKENANNELTLQHCRDNTYSEEALRKRLETRKERQTATSPKTVFQYTKAGKFMQTYYSMTEAEKATGINHNLISRVLDDNTQSAGGYLWTSHKVNNIFYSKRIHPNSKPILQFDKDGNFIREWNSISEAAKSLKLESANILRNIKSNAVPRKYKFKYKEM